MSQIEQVKGKDIHAETLKYIETLDKIALPHIVIYTVIFSFNKKDLNVLLLRFSNTDYFSLPGGFVLISEGLDDAAIRILNERTDINNLYLEQFLTTGKTDDSSRQILNKTFAEMGVEFPDDSWINRRKISVCYYSLIDEAWVTPHRNDFLVSEVKWVPIKKLPQLLSDHSFIIEKAIERLQLDLDSRLASYNLMNETFTMAELQKLYEVVFQKKFTRSNFQRKMLSLNILERLEKKFTGNSHKAPYLYRFKN